MRLKSPIWSKFSVARLTDPENGLPLILIVGTLPAARSRLPSCAYTGRSMAMLSTVLTKLMPLALCFTLPPISNTRLPVFLALSPRLTASGPIEAVMSMSLTLALATRSRRSSLKLLVPVPQSTARRKATSASTATVSLRSASSVRPMASASAPRRRVLEAVMLSLSAKAMSMPLLPITSFKASACAPSVGSQLVCR